MADKPAASKKELAAVPTQSSLGLAFIHPFYGYSLNLPFWWRDSYQVAEQGNSTVFYYLPAQAGSNSAAPVRLFSIAILGKDDKDLNGEKIGESAAKSFWLEKSENASTLNGENKSVWQKMAGDVSAIGHSFKMVQDGQETALKEFIAGELGLKGTTTLPLLSYETLATEETGSSTKIYLWLAASQYAWRGSDLTKTDAINTPIVALWPKDGQAGYGLQKITIPRSGRYYQTDLKKLFPASVVQNPIFKDKTLEHDAMLQKLSDELSAGALAYFGASPITIKYGWLKKFNEDNGNVVAAVNEVSLEKISIGTTTKKTAGKEPAKCSPAAAFCQCGSYLVRNNDKTLYKYVVSSSTAVIINSATSTVSHPSPVALVNFIGAFQPTSTSLVKNQIYRLGLVDDIVVSINSI